MPRAKAPTSAEEKASEKPKTKAPPHPLFPTVDATTIHSLWLYRLVKPHPKARAVPERLARFEPQELTSDMQLEAYGGGVFRVTAVGAAGHLVGFPYEVRVRDQMGRVPELVSDFESAEEPRGLAAPGDDVAKMYRDLMGEQRKEFERMRAEDRSMADQNFAMFGALLDKSIQGMSAVVTASASATQPAQLPAASHEPPAWFRSELTELRKAHEADRAKRMELELELAKLKVRREASESGGGRRRSSELGLKDLIELAPTIAPMLKEFFRSEPSPAQLPGAHAAASEPVVEAIEVDGVKLPSVGALRAIVQANAASHARGESRDFLSAEALAAVASVRHRLPPEYLAAVAELTAPA